MKQGPNPYLAQQALAQASNAQNAPSGLLSSRVGITKPPPLSIYSDDEIMQEYLKRFSPLGKALNEKA